MTGISQTSTKRFQALIETVSKIAKTVRPDSRVALADRSSPTVVQRLDLDTGTLSKGEASYDVVILDSEASRRLSSLAIGCLEDQANIAVVSILPMVAVDGVAHPPNRAL